MNGCMLLLATVVIGVDFGWQPTEYGGFEYIIQIEPELFDIVKSGEPILNEIPREVRGADRLRIVVGTAKLPREGAPPSAVSPPAASTLSSDPSNNGLLDSLNTQLGPLAPPPVNPGFDLPKTNPTNPSNSESPKDDDNSFNGFAPPPLEQGKEIQTPIPDPDEQGRNSKESDKLNIVVAGSASLIPETATEPTVYENTSFLDKAQTSNSKIAPSLHSNSNAKEEQSASGAKSAKEGSWTPLTITSLLLFASIGLNIYLGALAKTFYQRCMQLSQQFRDERRRAG